MAYLCVQSLASWLYRSLSVLYILAISGTNGSSGFGSVKSEQMESKTGRESMFKSAMQFFSLQHVSQYQCSFAMCHSIIQRYFDSVPQYQHSYGTVPQHQRYLGQRTSYDNRNINFLTLLHVYTIYIFG